MAEVNKELDFDLNASSPIHVSVVENRDLYLTCAFTKPLRRHRISFLSLKDFGLLYIGQARQEQFNHRSVCWYGLLCGSRWAEPAVINIKLDDLACFKTIDSQLLCFKIQGQSISRIAISLVSNVFISFVWLCSQKEVSQTGGRKYFTKDPNQVVAAFINNCLVQVLLLVVDCLY